MVGSVAIVGYFGTDLAKVAHGLLLLAIVVVLTGGIYIGLTALAAALGSRSGRG